MWIHGRLRPVLGDERLVESLASIGSGHCFADGANAILHLLFTYCICAIDMLFCCSLRMACGL
jgi:hypothetical protein